MDLKELFTNDLNRLTKSFNEIIYCVDNKKEITFTHIYNLLGSSDILSDHIKSASNKNLIDNRCSVILLSKIIDLNYEVVSFINSIANYQDDLNILLINSTKNRLNNLLSLICCVFKNRIINTNTSTKGD